MNKDKGQRYGGSFKEKGFANIVGGVLGMKGIEMPSDYGQGNP